MLVPMLDHIKRLMKLRHQGRLSNTIRLLRFERSYCVQ